MENGREVCGIIINLTGGRFDMTETKILGRSCCEWVGLALGEDFFGVVDVEDERELLSRLKGNVDRRCKVVVVLYSDTPLVDRTTVLDAVYTLKRDRLNVLKLERGYVFATDFLLGVEELLTPVEYSVGGSQFVLVDSQRNLALITKQLRDRILDFHMGNGVCIVDPNSTSIDCDVFLASGVVIERFNTIKNKCDIKCGAILGVGNCLDNCVIDSFASINNSTLVKCCVGKHTTIGPYAHIRPDSVIGENCKIGNFVEIKKSIIGKNTKIAHHTYIGDASVGDNCNIGCGVITANYDGNDKKPTQIGNNVFVGANSTLIAPLVIADDSFVAAGSTLTDSVPKGSLAIARARQVNKTKKHH